MIRHDSPLRRLPLGMDPRQLVLIDGLRLSLESAAMAYQRLHDGLVWLSQERESNPERHNRHIAASLDAWSVVDSLRRFRRLVQHTPGIKKRSAGVVQFVKGTESLEGLRDSAQHLEERTKRAIEERLPFFGVLTWTSHVPEKPDRIWQHMLVMGASRDGAHTLPVPLGRRIRGDVDHVILSAFGEKANISDAIRLADNVGAGIERTLASQVGASEPHFGADLLVRVELLVDSQPPESASPTESGQA